MASAGIAAAVARPQPDLFFPKGKLPSRRAQEKRTAAVGGGSQQMQGGRWHQMPTGMQPMSFGGAPARYFPAAGPPGQPGGQKSVSAPSSSSGLQELHMLTTPISRRRAGWRWKVNNGSQCLRHRAATKISGLSQQQSSRWRPCLAQPADKNGSISLTHPAQLVNVQQPPRPLPARAPRPEPSSTEAAVAAQSTLHHRTRRPSTKASSTDSSFSTAGGVSGEAHAKGKSSPRTEVHSQKRAGAAQPAL